MLAERGLGEKHIKFVVDCIQGHSESLIGEMLHPLSGDKVDLDRQAYTLLIVKERQYLIESKYQLVYYPKDYAK